MMAAVAARYGEDGEFWRLHEDLPHRPVLEYEIWNEENSAAVWCPAPDPAAYAELFAQTARAIRVAAPEGRVVIGGLAAFHQSSVAGATVKTLAADEFLRAAVAARPDLPRLADAVAFHVYGTPDVVASELGWFRGVLDGVGMERVPMVFNETGWFTAGEAGTAAPTPEETRAQYATRTTEAVAAVREDCEIAGFALHTWLTLEEDPADHEHWYGLGEPGSGDPYPSADAFGESVRGLHEHGPAPVECGAVPPDS
jgi:hypothetical protein